jgi:PAS domain-containing protein
MIVPFGSNRVERLETLLPGSAQPLPASEPPISCRRSFEAAKDGVPILDVGTGRIHDVNPFLYDLLGFPRREMVGKTLGELYPFKAIDSECMKGIKELGAFWAAVPEPLPPVWREETGVQNSRGALSKEMRSANEIPAPHFAPGG